MTTIFEAKTVQTAIVKSLFEVLKEVLIDLNLFVTKDKIKIVSMNNKQDCLIYVKLEAKEFEYFHCNLPGEGPLVLGIHTDNIFKIIKTIKHDETISFYVTDKNPHNLYIKKENNERNSINTFSLKLHDLPRDGYDIPELQYTTTITMNSNELQKICKDFVSLGGKLMEIKTIGEQIFFSGEGEFSSFNLIIGTSSKTSFQGPENEIVQGKFPAKYLLLFSKASILSSVVQISLKNDHPIIMSYNVGNLGEMKFIISCV